MIDTTLQYSSSFDGVGPLLADVRCLRNGVKKPVLLIMHGYAGDRRACRLDLEELGRRNVVAVTPDMRGRGGSAGVWDSGGIDVHDAVDAALATIREFPEEADASNINIVGYSGGGGIAIAAGCRFPDLFNTAVSFFGIPDYAGWWRNNTRPDCMETMRQVIGTPDDQLENYEARDMIPAARNAMKTRWWFLWDSEETMCPISCVEEWMKAFATGGGDGGGGGKGCKRSVTTPKDAIRWIHNYRAGNRQLTLADDLYLPDVLAGPVDGGLKLPPAGELVVPGHLVTRHFRVVVADGTRGAVRIRYKLDSGKPSVEVIDNPRGLPVAIHYDSPTAKLGLRG
ncbi:MAG: prolyl oligopeptidase family serine peptidase [Planctomycetota bacterium]|nr:prolyl oligopeptidase family serine peptidase [Planctomycetota bacterium]